jgi:hypothetical protein
MAGSFRAPRECSGVIRCVDIKKCDRPKDSDNNHLRNKKVRTRNKARDARAAAMKQMLD